MRCGTLWGTMTYRRVIFHAIPPNFHATLGMRTPNQLMCSFLLDGVSEEMLIAIEAARFVTFQYFCLKL